LFVGVKNNISSVPALLWFSIKYPVPQSMEIQNWAIPEPRMTKPATSVIPPDNCEKFWMEEGDIIDLYVSMVVVVRTNGPRKRCRNHVGYLNVFFIPTTKAA